MRGWRLGSASAIGAITTSVAVSFLVLGTLVGWVLPHLNDWFPSLVDTLPFARDALTPVAGSGIDPAPIVGADLTTLAVIIAVLIGYNVAALQIAGQTLSLALTRAILLTMGPLLCCGRASPSSRWSTSWRSLCSASSGRHCSGSAPSSSS